MDYHPPSIDYVQSTAAQCLKSTTEGGALSAAPVTAELCIFSFNFANNAWNI